MVAGLSLVCPVRGRLKAKSRSADGLKPSEERLRVEAIRHLIRRGYPRENIRVEAAIKRFGNTGRNSFRADLVVLDKPVGSVPSDNVDVLLQHAVILGEIKRDNADADAAKSFQVRPMLDFAARDDCVALYWDDVEQRVYWATRLAGRKTVHEGPLSALPAFGDKPSAVKLTLDTIDPDKPLLAVFKRIEDLLHSASIGPSKRFKIILQLLLAKLYDEHEHEAAPSAPLAIQDFAALEVDAFAASRIMDGVLDKAVHYYQRFLPEPVDSKLPLNGEILLEVLRVLAPVKITSARHSVIQDFYMYFARHIYKWDLAQYFTPTTLTEFIVEVLNPRFAEHIKDPACGSADFLTAAFRRGQHWPDYASSVWGSDLSPEAVQIAVLNMLLNGDGKSNITNEDSLHKVMSNLETCDIVVCNPPFGTKIVERSPEKLANFDLGHDWKLRNGRWGPSEALLKFQEVGLLFAEVCIRLLRPGGRFALVVPNGYLGNRSKIYYILREWILRHCRISVIVGLPRFTFKGSGASVAASVIFCEKRDQPLPTAADAEEYEFSVEIVERVGWSLGDKKGEPIYRRDPEDGAYLVDDDGQLIVDSDFANVLSRIRASDASQQFDWLTEGLETDRDALPGWSVSISDVVSEKHLTLDPKRHCKKYRELKASIENRPHFALGDVVDFVDEGVGASGQPDILELHRQYRYVEISDVGIGTYRWQSLRGWELPSRAKHRADPGDIYIGSIWSCVRKWFIASRDCQDLVVTNGLLRMRLKPGADDYLLDLVVGLCSEAYATQMRAFARGSDGLAEISADDAQQVLLPRIVDPPLRFEMQTFVDQLVSGFTSVEAKVSSLLVEQRLPLPVPPSRPDHNAVV